MASLTSRPAPDQSTTVDPGNAASETIVTPRPGRRLPALTRPAAMYAASRWIMLMIVGVAVKLRTDLHFADALRIWDGGWYLAVVKLGYPRGIPMIDGHVQPSTLAFFPLLPLAIKGVHAVTGLSAAASGLLVTTLMGLAFVVVLWSLLRSVFGDEVADRATLLVCFFPGFFVFGLIYAEPLSLLFSVVCLYALLERRWLLAGLAAAVASAAHPDALILTACCAWSAGVTIWQRREWRSLIAPVLAPTGLLAFFAYLRVHTGSARAYLIGARAQGWDDRLSALHWFKLLQTLWQHPLHDLNLFVPALGVIFVLVTVPLLVTSTFPMPVKIYGVGLGLLHLLTSLGPRPRFVLAAFPLIVVVAQRLRGLGFSVALALSASALGAVGVITIGSLLLVP